MLKRLDCLVKHTKAQQFRFYVWDDEVCAMQFKLLCTLPIWALEDSLLVWMDQNPMSMDQKSSKAYPDLLNIGNSCVKMTPLNMFGQSWTIDSTWGSLLINHASTQSHYPFIVLASKLDNNYEIQCYVVQQWRRPWGVHNGWTLLCWPYSQSSSFMFCVAVDCYKGYTILICARNEEHPKPIGLVKASFPKFHPTSPNFSGGSPPLIFCIHVHLGPIYWGGYLPCKKDYKVMVFYM